LPTARRGATPLAQVVNDAGAKLRGSELGWIDPVAHAIHTNDDEIIEYDALVLAPRLTCDARTGLLMSSASSA
jgi:hypothetical protein